MRAAPGERYSLACNGFARGRCALRLTKGGYLTRELKMESKRKKAAKAARQERYRTRRKESERGEVVIHFGKYKGRMIKDIPEDYLVWLITNCLDLEWRIKHCIQDFLVGNWMSVTDAKGNTTYHLQERYRLKSRPPKRKRIQPTPSKESIGPLYKPSQDQGVPWE